MKYYLPRRNGRSGVITSAFFSIALLFAVQNAKALTFILDFTSLNTAETMFGAENYTTNALTLTDFFSPRVTTLNTYINAVLEGVIKDYTGYPTVGANAASPILVGKELNINFQLGSVFIAPSNSDPEYYFMKVGDPDPINDSGSPLGHACGGCVRNGMGTGPAIPNAGLVGSILTDKVSGVNGGFNDLIKQTNLLVGTISHEIGHTLGLDHAAKEVNPGESDWTIMGTGAMDSEMPNEERFKDRAFSYTQMTHLVTAVGLRDVTPVPLPASVYLFGASMALLGFMQRRRRVA
jgi:hypothetical protein